MPKRKLSTNPDLSDHKRHGKKLLAPFSAILQPKFGESEWILERLPECVWIHEVFHFLGPQRTIAVLKEFVMAYRATWREGDKGNPLVASTWHYARNESKAYVRRSVRAAGMLEDLDSSLAVLLHYYPDYPLNFLKLTNRVDTENRLLAFKQRLRSLFSRFERPAVTVNAISFLVLNRAGELMIPSNMDLPPLRPIFDKSVPSDAPEFDLAASCVRAMGMGIFAQMGQTMELVASRDFWNRGLQLESCTNPFEASDGKKKAEVGSQK